LFQNLMTENEKNDVQKSSLLTVFTIWNVMVGASILTMPYAFYNSGLIVGFFITFLSFFAQLRTCIYVTRSTDPTGDYYDTLRKYWGLKGVQTYLGFTVCVCEAAVIAYFMALTQLLYKCCLFLLNWIFSIKLESDTGTLSFGTFS